MSAPRLHHQALPDSLRVEANGLAPAVNDSLTRWATRSFSAAAWAT